MISRPSDLKFSRVLMNSTRREESEESEEFLEELTARLLSVIDAAARLSLQ